LGRNEYNRLIEDEKLLGLGSYKDRVVGAAKEEGGAIAAERQTNTTFNLKGSSGNVPKIDFS